MPTAIADDALDARAVSGGTIFLDRDGTIIVERDYIHNPADVALEIGAAAGLRALTAAGFRLVVLTNQSGVARGYFDLAAVWAVNRRVADLLDEAEVTIAGWYVCPHGPSDGCACRKPRPGLAYHAAIDGGLALAGSWVVGDKRSDVELADAIGASGILVTTGHGADHVAWAHDLGHPVVSDLVGASDFILAAAA
ncbi:D-glycero-alpha-D-manno-heptose-1,7-bisphosphate 7-phosphatase [uncultured Sphingomonas sp.]|uniref:D-glycero-alpha-D-manno-heptose-1,7-bisphosphate 7-phosphatase n=1 Tax=uncultured Sphingomonas sp. TaxID=158754 RepID=UPI0035C95DB9